MFIGYAIAVVAVLSVAGKKRGAAMDINDETAGGSSNAPPPADGARNLRDQAALISRNVGVKPKVTVRLPGATVPAGGGSSKTAPKYMLTLEPKAKGKHYTGTEEHAGRIGEKRAHLPITDRGGDNDDPSLTATSRLTHLYGEPPEAFKGRTPMWNGGALDTWDKVAAARVAVEKFRKRADALSSSSSFSSLAGKAYVKPLWAWGDNPGFADWVIRGGDKHVVAVVKRIKETGGNESFWGGEGGFSDIVEFVGNIAGTVLSGGAVTDAGTKISNGYGTVVSTAADGDFNRVLNAAKTYAKGYTTSDGGK